MNRSEAITEAVGVLRGAWVGVVWTAGQMAVWTESMVKWIDDRVAQPESIRRAVHAYVERPESRPILGFFRQEVIEQERKLRAEQEYAQRLRDAARMISEDTKPADPLKVKKLGILSKLVLRGAVTHEQREEIFNAIVAGETHPLLDQVDEKPSRQIGGLSDRRQSQIDALRRRDATQSEG